MRGTFNLRFFLVVVATTAVFAVGWFGLHRYQQNRHRAGYLDQATRAEAEQKPDRAARLLRAYILAVPGDIDARVRYGGLLEKLSKTPRAKSDALSVYEEALRRDPGRTDARRRAAELAIELNRTEVSHDHVTALLAADENDGRALYLLGLCCEAKGRALGNSGEANKWYQEAVKAYARSCAAAPTPEAFVRRAGVRKNHLGEIDETKDGTETGPQADLNDLVRVLPNSFESYLARAAYRKTYDPTNGLARARPDLETARKLVPGEPEKEVPVLLASAIVAVESAARHGEPTDAARAEREKYWEEARGYLRRGSSKFSHVAELYLALADVETRAGRRTEAIKVLTNGRKKVTPDGLPEVLFALAEQFAETGDAGAKEALDELGKLKQDPTRIDFFRGLSFVRQKKWNDACGVLERVRPLWASTPERAVQIDLLLAQCYGKLGDPNRQLLTYRRAVTAAPLDYRPRFGLAGTMVVLGRSAEAIDEYRHITQMRQSPVAAWFALARLLADRNLVRAPQDRQWDELNTLLGKLEGSHGNSTEFCLLKAEVHFARGESTEAERLLHAAQVERPGDPELWFALATLTDRRRDTDRFAAHAGIGGGIGWVGLTDPKRSGARAHAILDEAKARFGDSVELRLARLRITKYESEPQALGAINALAAGAERFPEDDRVRLLRALASAYWLIGRPAEAAGLWEQIAALQPNDLAVRLLRFDAALKRDDDAGMQQALDEVGKIEGNGPLTKYGTAIRLIWRASRHNDRSGLPQARDLLAEVAGARSGWARVPLALSQIDELEKNDRLMLEHLRQAIRDGDRQLSVIKRVVRLLDEDGHPEEADKILRDLEKQAPISTELQRLDAEMSLRRLDVDRAVKLARDAVSANSKDYKERVWLGRILSAGGGTDATEVFESAVALAGDKSDVWVAFVQHMVRRDKDPVRIGDVLKRADAALRDKNLLDLALCYSIADRRAEAEKCYLAAIGAQPTSAGPVRKTAEFYQQTGNPEKADPLLRRIVSGELKATEEDVRWARRNLALIVGLRGDEPGFLLAQELLQVGKDDLTRSERADYLRTDALIRSVRSGQRKEVITLLESAAKLKAPRADHEFLLAKLYEVEGNRPQARTHMTEAIRLQPQNPVYIGAFARSLIRWGELKDAAYWVNRLTEVAPNAPPTVTVQVQFLCRQGRAADAVPAIRRFAETKDDPTDREKVAARALGAAELFDQVYWAGAGKEAAGAAELHYVKCKELSPRPDAGLPLAGFYGRHDQPDKALALCEETRKGCPLEVVIVSGLTALSSTAATAAHFDKVEGWLNEALGKMPDSVNLRFLLGALREQRGRLDKAEFARAETEYRKVLAAVPTHAWALNNLTCLLAFSGRGAEAVPMAERLLATAPDAPPALLDTRAVAHAAAGDFGAARKDLEAAVAAGGDAVAYFHLAEVYARSNDKAKAAVALRQARNAGLRPGLLHPLERPTYDRLAAELKP